MSLQAKATHELEHQRLGVASIVLVVLAAVTPAAAVGAIVPFAIANSDPHLGNGASESVGPTIATDLLTATAGRS